MYVLFQSIALIHFYFTIHRKIRDEIYSHWCIIFFISIFLLSSAGLISFYVDRNIFFHLLPEEIPRYKVWSFIYSQVSYVLWVMVELYNCLFKGRGHLNFFIIFSFQKTIYFQPIGLVIFISGVFRQILKYFLSHLVLSVGLFNIIHKIDN